MRLNILFLSADSFDPYLEFSENSKTATYHGQWIRFPLSPQGLELSADDCLTSLTINQQNIHSDSVCTSCKDCSLKSYDYKSSPFVLNSVEASVQNTGGRGGINSPQTRPSIPLALLTVFIFGLYFIRKFQDPYVLAPMLFLSCIVYLYFKDTDLFVRQQDLLGHVDYIKYLFQYRRLPPVKQGWETHQAPFYYWIASILTPTVLWAQFLGFVSVLATMTLWARFVSNFKKHWVNSILIFAFLGVPSFWYLSARINNDVFLPFFSVVTLVFWTKMHLKAESSTRSAIFLGMALMLMLLTKVSAVSIYLSVGLASLWVRRVSLKNLCLAYSPGFLALLALMARTYSQTQKLFFVPMLKPGLIVGNHPSIYFSFDFYEYFTARAAETWKGPVREHFWEFLFISAQSSEYSFVWNNALLVIGLRILILIGVIGIIRGIRLTIKNPTPLGTYASITSLSSLLFLIYFRIAGNNGQAAACLGDARFLVLAYPSFAILIAIAALKRNTIQSHLNV